MTALTPNECAAARFLDADGYSAASIADALEVSATAVTNHASGECSCPRLTEPTHVMPVTGDRLVAARAEADLTRSQVATAVGVSPSTLSAWERDDRDQSTAMAHRLVELFRDHHVYPATLTDTPTDPPSPDAIRSAREAADLSQRDLAERLGVSEEAVRRWEIGETTPQRTQSYLLHRALDSLEDDVCDATATDTIDTPIGALPRPWAESS